MNGGESSTPFPALLNEVKEDEEWKGLSPVWGTQWVLDYCRRPLTSVGWKDKGAGGPSLLTPQMGRSTGSTLWHQNVREKPCFRRSEPKSEKFATKLLTWAPLVGTATRIKEPTSANLILGAERKEGKTRESLMCSFFPHPNTKGLKLTSLTPGSYLPPAYQANLHLAPKAHITPSKDSPLI